MFRTFLIVFLLISTVSLISCVKFNFNPHHQYNANTHPSIVLQLLEDNKHLFSIQGIFDIILNILDDLEKAFDDPKTTNDIYSCAFALDKYLVNLKNTSMWALKMLDASSKIPTGLLMGHFVDLGQYDECVRINAPLGESYTIYGQHCLIDFKISIPSDLTLEIGGVQQPISVLLGSNTLTLSMGQCFPSDCKPYIIEHIYNTAFYPINYFINGSGYNVTSTVAPSDCHLYNRGEYTIAEWIVMIVIALILFVAVVCTSADLFSLHQVVKRTPPNAGIQTVLAFSVTRNFNKLVSPSSSAETMSAINGLKVFSILWVVLGHRYRYLMTMPIVNLMDIADQLKLWTKMFIFSAPLSVDTFFMISGLLNMYVFCNLREKRRRFTIVELIINYIHRYIRLTPAYAFMIALTATWIYRIGDGPLWDRIMGSASDQCKTGWWENIVYLNNYLNPDTYCMMQSWYLSADMQMYWLSPLLVYPLWRWPWFGYIEVIILTIVSIASPFLISFYEDIKTPIPISTNSEEQARIMDELYLPTHTKMTAYIIGILTGYLIFCFKKEKIKFRMNRIISALLWVATAICMLYAMFGGFQLVQMDVPYSRVESAFYIGFFKFFWSLGIMWIIIACTMGYGGLVNSLLSIQIFGTLGRLTYCIYLTHIAVILYDISSRRVTTYYTDYNQVQTFFGDMFFIIICATILSVLLESPLMTIEKLVFGRREKPRRQETARIEPLTQAGPIHDITESENTSSE